MDSSPAALAEPTKAASPPKVSLNRAQWVRLAIVGFFAAFAIGRVAPDVIRIAQPLGMFGYATDGDGIVVTVPERRMKGSDEIRKGDRVRVDRIKAFDRKPGLTGVGFTRENFDRRLAVERDGRVRMLHLKAENEPLWSRITALLRILIYMASVFAGAILFLIKPSLATGSFFAFCLGGDYPTTYTDVMFDRPWREIPQWLGDAIRGAAAPALLLFAACLFMKAERRRAIVLACAGLALLLGVSHAYGNWVALYGSGHAERLFSLYRNGTTVVTVVTIIVFAVTFLQARGIERSRSGMILSGFAVAAVARLVSVQFFPAHLSPWLNGVLQTAPVIPIALVWIAVVRHRFFNVDFVVSRGIVFMAVTVALIGMLTVTEEILTYVFYNNTDLYYGIFIAVSLAVGALFGKTKEFFDRLVDRFIFRDRHSQRVALDFIGGYILDAESDDEVYRALLEDAPHALKLTFGGVMTKRPDGGFELEHSWNWPEDCHVRLAPGDELTKKIDRSRGMLTFSGKDTSLITKAFPNERLTFAAPIFSNRTVGAIVVYGNNISGLDLDPEERELLVRVVSNASIALNANELARYRAAAEASKAALSAAGGPSAQLLGSG